MKEQRIIEHLSALGMSKYAANCYLHLLQLGPAFMQEIVSKTNLHRPTVYKGIAELEEAGLVTKIKAGKRYSYHPESPEQLQSAIIDLTGNLHQGLSELKEIYKLKKHETFVYFFEGKKAMTSIYKEIVTTMKHGETFYRLGSARSKKTDSNYYPANYRRLRDQKQLQRFIITNESQAKQFTPSLNRKVKVLKDNFGEFFYNVTEIVYGDKIAYFDFNNETALVIKNQHIANFHRHLARSLFNRLPE